MSSKGPTAAGSDGSDFSHRQKVADHYKIRYLLGLNEMNVCVNKNLTWSTQTIETPF